MKKTRVTKKRKILILLSIFLILVLIFLYVTKLVNPILIEASEAKVKSVVQKAMSSSVLTSVTNANTYDNILNYKHDSEGNISMIEVNTYEVNILTRQITSLAQNTIDNTSEAGVDIHLGAFTGMAFLANVGPLISFNLTPIGTVTITFRSVFETAGINQTHHKIYVTVESAVYVILPTASPKISLSTEMLISECIVVGKIPETYLQSGNLDEMLNLVP